MSGTTEHLISHLLLMVDKWMEDKAADPPPVAYGDCRGSQVGRAGRRCAEGDRVAW